MKFKRRLLLLPLLAMLGACDMLRGGNEDERAPAKGG